MKKNFEIEGMTCTACALAIENSVKKIEGVQQIAVNYATEEMVVTFNDDLNEEIIKEQVKNAGYKVVSQNKTNSQNQQTNKTVIHQEEMKSRLIRSLIFAIPLFYLTMGGMIGLPIPSFFIGDKNSLIFAFTQLLLTIPVMITGLKYYQVGFKTLFKLAPNMDSLVAMGTGVAFIYGVAVTYILIVGFANGDSSLIHSYSHKLYFESVVTILSLITLGKYLEARAKTKTHSALNSLIELSPKTATVFRDGKELVVASEDILVGDILNLKPASAVAVDGVVISGISTIDESMLTGESIGVTKEKGDKVYCGTINKTGNLTYQATKIASQTMLSKIITLVKEAQSTKAPIAQLADKVSYIFVPTVIAIAIISFIIWISLGYDLEFAINIMVSILVISCPCALGLATPTAIMVGTGVSAKQGVLFKSAESLENLHKAETIVFDKTGTLTKGEIKLSSYQVYDNEALCYLYSLEKLSEHPLAAALCEFLEAKKIQVKPVADFNAKVGYGVFGIIDGKEVFAGNKKYLEQNQIKLDPQRDKPYEKEGKTKIYIAYDGKIAGIFALADVVKDEAKTIISELKKMNKKVVMITGDSDETGLAVGKSLGIEQVYSQILPDKKSAIVKELQKTGNVAMVGDGINDAVALASADIGIAVSSGTDIAIETADVVLMKNNLVDLLNAIRISQETIKNIKQNLFFAFIYNIIGIPIAAGVFYPAFKLLLNPMIGAFAMSMSSVSVVTNALRLRKFKSLVPRDINHDKEEESKKIQRKEIKTMEKTLKVADMSCKHCSGRVEKILSEIAGVSAVKVDLEKGEAYLTLSENLADEILTKPVTDAGYPATVK